MTRSLILWLLAASLFCGTSCSPPDIPVTMVSHTSDLLHCHRVFGPDVKSMLELNRLLLQTGRVDTADERILIAIIHIDKKEVILHYENARETDGKTVETYGDDHYHLVLEYDSKKEDGKIVHHGFFIISDGNKKSKYTIEGLEGCASL